MKTVSQLTPAPDHTRQDGTTLPCRLRAIRARHGLTIEQVSKHAGVGKATIMRVEAGGDCTLIVALRLAYFFEMSIEDIWPMPQFASKEERLVAADDVLKAARMVGLFTRVARRTGRTRSHVRRVLLGQRTSAQVMRAAREELAPEGGAQ